MPRGILMSDATIDKYFVILWHCCNEVVCYKYLPHLQPAVKIQAATPFTMSTENSEFNVAIVGKSLSNTI